jgi:exodeoxyribonuclease VII small subunit
MRPIPWPIWNWQAEDYAWLTGRLCDVAARHAGGRVVSTLEGGYDLAGACGFGRRACGRFGGAEQMTAKAVSEMSFEEAMAALEQVVNQLERGEVALEESIALYERGAALKAHCG